MTQDWTQTARTLKAVVIVLGVAIVTATAIVAVEIFRRAGGIGERPPGDVAAATVPLSSGERVIGMTGDDDALSLLIEGADGRQRVLTVDRTSGAVLGTLSLEPAP